MVTSRKKILLGSLSLVLLSGCASPLVKYGVITGSDEKGLAKFSFTESVVKFNLKAESITDAPNVNIASVPVPESNEKLYYISGTSVLENWGVTTDIVPAYRGDTKLLKSVAVTTTDKRMYFLEKAAGIVAKTMTVSSGGPFADLPDGVLMQPLLNECGKNACKKEQTSGSYSIEITIANLPVDAFTRPVIDGNNYKTNAFLYSACRNVNIRLKRDNQLIAESSVTVADSNYVEAIAFPEKGTVTVGPSCSATAEAAVSSNPGAMEYIDSLLGVAQTVATARKTRAEKDK